MNIKNLLSLTILISPVLAQCDPLTLPPITVNSNPLNPSLFEYGKPASVLSKEKIESRMQTTLGETIALEPGVRSSFFGPGASRPVIRGFAGERVRVMKNGVGTGDVSEISEDHVVVADPMQAEQIEILRGPETLLYGSSAIGGAVNVIDDSIAEKPVDREFTGELRSQLGDSADDEKTYGVKIKGEIEKFNWYLSGFSRDTNDYKIPGYAESSQLREMQEAEHEEEHEEEKLGEEKHSEEVKGKVPNTDTETRSGTVGGSYIWDKGFIGLSYADFRSDYGIPGHNHPDEIAHEDNETEPPVRIESQQQRVDLRGRVDQVSEAIESIKFRLGSSDYKHLEMEGDEIGTSFKRERVETRVEFIHAPILSLASLKGVFGAQLSYDDFSAIGAEAFLTPTKTWTPALFAFERLELQKDLNLEFGCRIEAVNINPLDQDSKNFLPVSLSAGPVWDPFGDKKYNLGLTLAYTERAPSSVELFAHGPHFARQIFEQGDLSLNKESSLGVDLSLRKNQGSFRTALTPFFQSFNDYINLAATEQESDNLRIYNYQGIDAYFWGYEFTNSLYIDELVDLGAHGLALDFQVDYVQAKNKTVAGDLPRIPPLRTIARARYDYKEKFSAMIEGVFVQAQHYMADFELPTDGYTMFNAEASYKLDIAEKNNLKLFIRGTNLTNEEARVHSSFIKDLAPMRGQAILFGLKAEF